MAIVLATGAGTVAADPSDATMRVTGDVIAAQGHFTSDGTRIVTLATVRDPYGHETVVSQLGGHADGMTMVQMPSPPQIEVGMNVTVAAHPSATLAGQMQNVVDDVIVHSGGIAAPYVRTGPTSSGHSVHWESNCAQIVDAAEGTIEIAGEDEFPIIDSAINTWATGVASCSYMHIVAEGKVANQEVGRDFINVLKFRDTTWGRPAVDGDPARPYNAAAAGITTVTFVDSAGSSRDGAIVDADVEINGVNFAISTGGVSLGSQTCLSDLGNTVTHELGHFQGLEHTCRVATDPQRVDGNGDPVPLCTDVLTPAEMDATMYPFQACGETSKTTLTADDIAGICAAYPLASAPTSCSGDDSGSSSGGCDASGGSPIEPIVLRLFAAFALLAVTRRRL